jgi:hypothetical protein
VGVGSAGAGSGAICAVGPAASGAGVVFGVGSAIGAVGLPDGFPGPGSDGELVGVGLEGSAGVGVGELDAVPGPLGVGSATGCDGCTGLGVPASVAVPGPGRACVDEDAVRTGSVGNPERIAGGRHPAAEIEQGTGTVLVGSTLGFAVGDRCDEG